MERFVVYLIKYRGDKLPKYYIGSTSEVKLKNGYLGSVRSKKWRELFQYEVKNNRYLFESEILSIHLTREDALLNEYKIQKENDVVKSTLYFNESFANINGYFGRDVTGEINPMYGRKNEVIAINVKTKEKIRVSKDEFKSNNDLSGHTFGLVSVITENGDKKIITRSEFNINREKYKHHNDGREHGDELKQKLSEMRVGLITARDWDGNFHRIHKDDIRLKNGEFGNTTSKRWVITDLDGNVYRTFNFRRFFNDNNLQYPQKKNIDGGVINFKLKSKNKSTNGWKVECLN